MNMRILVLLFLALLLATALFAQSPLVVDSNKNIRIRISRVLEDTTGQIIDTSVYTINYDLQRLNPNGAWTTVITQADPDTVFVLGNIAKTWPAGIYVMGVRARLTYDSQESTGNRIQSDNTPGGGSWRIRTSIPIPGVVWLFQIEIY